jgi:hypothetical protein
LFVRLSVSRSLPIGGKKSGHNRLRNEEASDILVSRNIHVNVCLCVYLWVSLSRWRTEEASDILGSCNIAEISPRLIGLLFFLTFLTFKAVRNLVTPAAAVMGGDFEAGRAT